MIRVADTFAYVVLQRLYVMQIVIIVICQIEMKIIECQFLLLKLL